MVFLWPDLLWLLLALPVLVMLYLWLLRRRRSAVLHYPALALAREAQGARARWRRHVPPLLFLLGLAALLVAAARPLAVLTLPSQQQTIMLAMDVSGSMRAADVHPDRLTAAQDAAKAFIAELPRHVRVGIVAFAGSAQLAQLPTQNHEDLVKAIDSFQLQRGTATGNGILLSLATLFPDTGIDVSALGGRQAMLRPQSMDEVGRPPHRGSNGKGADRPAPVAPGSYTSAAIIMLTDGQRTTGVDPMEAAQWAADRGVRVYTVGVGTVAGETIGFEGWSMRVRLDEDTLKAVAQRTNAEYFHAATAADLKKVYETLSSRLTVEKKETEISALLALAGAALLVLAGLLSLWWFGRVL
ncbi:VWA domain-containing protein [Paracidovorax cattleyae]|uniref:Ca-activated chloride channel family protein n=1 Tax=Paracidovorax cattleyae TaxID=80868 RepID=A0A1H0UFF8_9BURK|nr:VWA domain-containing protein [Paracidovorax cattleyae]SDP64800.1 Ca-activated chloride channel family protein [Paracidovorax cattleyae]